MIKYLLITLIVLLSIAIAIGLLYEKYEPNIEIADVFFEVAITNYHKKIHKEIDHNLEFGFKGQLISPELPTGEYQQHIFYIVTNRYPFSGNSKIKLICNDKNIYVAKMYFYLRETINDETTYKFLFNVNYTDKIYQTVSGRGNIIGVGILVVKSGYNFRKNIKNTFKIKAI